MRITKGASLACALLVLCLSPRSDEADLTLERIFLSDDFREESFGPARWLPDGSGYVVVEESDGAAGGQDLVLHDVLTGEERILVASRHLVPGEGRPLVIEDYAWSHDGAYLLIYTNSERVWRARTRGDYWIFDVNSHQLVQLGGDAAPSTLMFATFSPVDHRVAYVRERNLYVEDWKAGTILRLTESASEHIINGTFDWVYEEEFRLRNGFRWSPDGKRIAYWQIGTEGVGVFHLIDNTGGLYPRLVPIPYPKVGETNPSCRVGVVSSTGSHTLWMKLPGDTRNHYVAYLDWCDENSLVLQQLNRLQNTNRLMIARLLPDDDWIEAHYKAGRAPMPHQMRIGPSGRIPSPPQPDTWGQVVRSSDEGYQLEGLRTLITDTDDAWVEVVKPLHWTEDRDQFFWLSERDGWRHLYTGTRSGKRPRVSVQETGPLRESRNGSRFGNGPRSRRRAETEAPAPDAGDPLALLTRDEHDVISLEGIDEKRGWIYYLASPDNPTQRYLYRVPLSGGRAIRVTPADRPGVHSYQFSPDMRHAIHTWSAANRPSTRDLITIPDHAISRSLTTNDDLRKAWEALDRKPIEFFRVPIGEGVELDGWLISPPDREEGKRYPLLVFVYGEPAGQTVMDRWGGRRQLWHLMHAQKGYFVMSIDNRGTPAPRGRWWRKIVYRQVGILAPRDQAAALDAVLERHPEIDPGRVGIWGWSGGGSMTLNMMFKYPEKYAVGMSIAPVPNQRLYDTIYQERYMGLPAENVRGYRDGSPIHFASGLQGDLLLVHGTGDDNVHYQGTEVLIDELVALDKPFSMMAYPNRSHAIREGVNTTPHLYSLLTRYLYSHLPAGAH